MPGTIQVSVLDFKGLHSSSLSSSSSSKVSIKVSKGKIEYQTWDKGEFSFPLTTLRDNLIITIQDAEGNEISHTGLETRLVVEKGVWDDIFPLEGGGHAHMKLQFFLNEEERQRIRIMRESALKKKHEELCNSGHGSPKNASVSYSEASQLSVPLNNPKDAKFDIDNRDRSYSIQKQKSTDSVPSEPEKHNNSKKKHEKLRDSGHGSPNQASVSYSEVSGSKESSFRSGLLANEANQVSVPLNNANDANFDITSRNRSSIQKQKSTDSVPSELEKRNNSKKPRPAEKCHSNVKNMINAFEGSLFQDVRPSIKPPPKISQTRKIGANSFLVNSHLNEAETEKIISPKVTLGTINREKVQTFGSVEPIYGAAPSKESEQLKDKFKVKQRESVVKEEKKYSKDFKRASITEKAEFSQRILDKYSKGNQSWNLFSAKQHSRRKSVTKEGKEENFQKDPREAEGTSNGKPKSVAIWSNHHCSIGSSGLWIFPGEAKCSCITTGAKQIMDQMGGFCDEANTHQINLSSCDPKSTEEANDADGGTAIVENEDGKTSEKFGRRVGTSMNPEESIGPFGKVIKVVVMVGFATLVLLTRRTYRYSCSMCNNLPSHTDTAGITFLYKHCTKRCFCRNIL
ncbi:Dystrophin-1 [Gossypium arboreum]|uniref:Dystrophin-1 n=1 Tax=Gossypium arboreum TaxID=29729 RepID=A0A0B0NKV5_GOSAR|nr:Dystrophin-1 [Gossypium arboreum]